jgi:hypothetical protein
MNRTTGMEKQPTSQRLDAERLALAERIAKHSPPIAVPPDAARMVLIRLSLEMLLKVENL